MTSFRVNDDEQAILRQSEISHAAKLLYLVGIRPRMDFRTGIVGKARRVSYQTFHEDIEYLPPQGSKRGVCDYGIAAIRALLDELARAGLIRRLPNDKRLIFLECLVADREDAPKNMNNRGTTKKNDTKNNTSKTSTANALSVGEHTENNTIEVGMNNIPLVSGKALSNSQAAALLNAPVDNFAVLRFVEIVEWLKTSEKRRGKIVFVAAGDAHVTAWVCRGVVADELCQAYALAAADRERQGNPAPISTGFLELFVSRVIAKRKPWFLTWSGIVEKALERDMVQEPGEQNYAFKLRVFAAFGVDEEEARQWQA